MFPRFSPRAVWSVVLACVVVAAEGLAQTSTQPEAEVNNVRFRQVRAQGSTNPWIEAEIVLQVRGNADDPVNPRWVSRLKTDLHIAYSLRRDGETRIDYYRASATAVAVEAGRTVVRFYLPPEVVKRDSLSTTPDFWLVVLGAGDRELPLRANNASSSLDAPDRAQRFRERAAAEAPVNDGILVPSYDSPFDDQSRGDSPTFIRS